MEVLQDYTRVLLAEVRSCKCLILKAFDGLYGRFPYRALFLLLFMLSLPPRKIEELVSENLKPTTCTTKNLSTFVLYVTSYDHCKGPRPQVIWLQVPNATKSTVLGPKNNYLGPWTLNHWGPWTLNHLGPWTLNPKP